MNVTVGMYASFYMIAGTRQVRLEVPEGSDLTDLVAILVSKFPALNKHWYDKEGELRVHVHVFLNGNDAQTLPGKMSTLLSQDDEVDFIPPVAGG